MWDFKEKHHLVESFTTNPVWFCINFYLLKEFFLTMGFILFPDCD